MRQQAREPWVAQIRACLRIDQDYQSAAGEQQSADVAAGEKAKPGTRADKGATAEQHAQSAAGDSEVVNSIHQQEETTSPPAQQEVGPPLLQLAGFPVQKSVQRCT